MSEHRDESPTLTQWVQRAVQGQLAGGPPTGTGSNPATLLPQAGGWWPAAAGASPSHPLLTGGPVAPLGAATPTGWPLLLWPPPQATNPQGDADTVPAGLGGRTPSAWPALAEALNPSEPGGAGSVASGRPLTPFPTWLPSLDTAAAGDPTTSDWDALVARAAGRPSLPLAERGDRPGGMGAAAGSQASAVNSGTGPHSYSPAVAGMPVPNLRELGGALGSVLWGEEVGPRAPSAADETATARPTFPPGGAFSASLPGGAPVDTGARPRGMFPRQATTGAGPVPPDAFRPGLGIGPPDSAPWPGTVSRGNLASLTGTTETPVGSRNVGHPRGDEQLNSPSDWLNWTRDLARDLWGVLDPSPAGWGGGLPGGNAPPVQPPGSDAGGGEPDWDRAAGLAGAVGRGGAIRPGSAGGPPDWPGRSDVWAELQDLARRLADLEQAHRS